MEKRNEQIELLEKYTLFLQKNGYIDTDATCEEPFAIDEFMKTIATLKLSESKQQLPVVKEPDGFVSGEYFVSINDYNANSCFRTNEWKPVYFSPQVVKDGFEKYLLDYLDTATKMRDDSPIGDSRDVMNGEVIAIKDTIASYRKFSPQVSPSDEEIIVSFQSIRFQYENNPNFTPKDVVNNLRTLFQK